VADAVRAAEEAANIRALKHAPNVTPDLAVKLEAAAQVLDRAVTRGGDDDRIYYAESAIALGDIAPLLEEPFKSLFAGEALSRSQQADRLQPPSVDKPVYAVYGAASDHTSFKVPYDGITVASNQFPFLDVAANNDDIVFATSVDWRLDGVLVRTVTNAPYFDFGSTSGGNPVAWDTTAVSGTTASPHTHTLEATITLNDGSTQVCSATVTVANPTGAAFHDLISVENDFTNAPFRTDAPWTHWRKHDKNPAGTPSGYDWYPGARGFVFSNQKANMWFEIADPLGGGVLYRCRVQMKDFAFYKWVAGPWSLMFSSDVIASNGGYWNGAYGSSPGQGNIAGFTQWGGVRAEAASDGGGTSVTCRPISEVANVDQIHAWPNYGAPFDISNALAIYATCQVRLIVDDISTVDLSTADLYIGMGCDLFNSSNVNIGGPIQTRYKKIGYKGQGGGFDGWTPAAIADLTPAGCTAMGISTTPTADALADAIKAFLIAHQPPYQAYP